MENESFFNVKSHTGPPSMDSDGEDSFEILGTHSLSDEASLRPPQEDVLAPIRMTKVHDMQNLIKMEISQINNGMPERPTENWSAVGATSANRALSPDSSHEEVQKHVEELIKENEKLKNIIAQNNVSMKSQYDRIVVWKDEVNNVLKSYKEKFAEAKQFIDKSKEENGKLTSEIEIYKNLKKLHEEEILNLRQKISDFENKRTVEDNLDKNINEMDLKILKDKARDLENELAESNLEKAEIMRENDKLIEKMIRMPKMEENLLEKDKLIEGLQQEIEEGKNREKIIEGLRGEIQTGKNREKVLLDNSIDLKNKIQELGQELEKKPAAPSPQILESYKKDIQSKNEEIKTLQEALKVAKAEIEKVKSQLVLLQQMHDPNLPQEFQNIRQQLSRAQMTVTALNLDMEAKVNEIERLKILLTQSSTKDEIYALKEQLVLYKSDFDAEKESKTAIKTERDQMAQDMKDMQNRNRQLQNEVERMRALNQPRSETNAFMCPRCSFGFNNYQSLENHVHRCLDLEGFP